jgi:hypothetical protein
MPALSPAQLLESVELMSPHELSEFVQKVLALRARCETRVLSDMESELLLKFNHAVPSDLQGRYDKLVQKRRSEVLSPGEHEELLQLSGRIEQLEAERVEALAKLAQARRTTLPKLLSELGVQPRSHG